MGATDGDGARSTVPSSTIGAAGATDAAGWAAIGVGVRARVASSSAGGAATARGCASTDRTARARVASASSSTGVSRAVSRFGTSIVVAAYPSSSSMRCSARANSIALGYRSSRRDDMPFASTEARLRGTSDRSIGVMAPRSMRPIRSRDPLGRPAISNGVRPASSVYTVAVSEKTSLRWSGFGSSWNISGGDHGTLMPTADCPEVVDEPADDAVGEVIVCTGSSPSRFDEIPKSVSAGHP